MFRIRSLIAALAIAAVLAPSANAAYSDKTFTVTNTGNGPMTIIGAGISGNTAEFALLPGHNCTTVAAGASCTMTVRFTPNGSDARTSASLDFSSNSSNGPTHSIALAGAGGASCTAGKQVFSYTGADQAITVPAGCSTATIKAWGAGGKAGYGTAGYPAIAGGGGFAQRNLTGLTSGSVLTVVVGQGATGLAATYGNGGAGSTYYSYFGGAGGGYSGVFTGAVTQANALVVAGGGGGAYSSSSGAGGGLSGGSGTNQGIYTAGLGGTQASGGAGGKDSVAGSALQGGNGRMAGGGGGYFGGGGSWYSPGGGSGYAPGGTLTTGSGCNVPNTTDPDYVVGVGNGGCSTNTSGQNGRVVIIWQ